MSDEYAAPFIVIERAIDKGWIDPGLTEPLEVTAQRARDYLAAIGA